MKFLMKPAISIKGIKKSFGDVQALRGVDLEIQQGEFFGLLGPNGAGKSTLISIIAGLTKTDAGSVAVLGNDVVTDYRDSRRSLGVVPQELVFDPFFLLEKFYEFRRVTLDWVERMIRGLKSCLNR